MSTILHYQLQQGVFVALTPPPSLDQIEIEECDFDTMMQQYVSSEPEPDFSRLPGESENVRFGRQAETEVESHFFVVEDEAQVQESELDVWRRGVQGATGRPATENVSDAMDRGLYKQWRYFRMANGQIDRLDSSGLGQVKVRAQGSSISRVGK
ncbi:hypothetical protein IFR05_002508 [Cadophora sp. M221]|nr:hypothetical protein IFR05_002508 [Cadophora sp. M221]